jgi:hypothetical protein
LSLACRVKKINEISLISMGAETFKIEISGKIWTNFKAKLNDMKIQWNAMLYSNMTIVLVVC